MKRICVLTATRAEYGLLKPLIIKLQAVPEFDVRLVVTGAHLSPEFGLTYQQIEKDGLVIDQKIEMLLSADTPAAISKSMGLALVGFADYFARLQPDLLVVLGDRYETLAVCCAAMNQRIPIAHLYGGETTEGAIDESIRHAITKLSYLHFTSTAEYRRRVIQLGEAPERVFAVGAMGIENILQEQLCSKAELARSLKLKLAQPYALVTFHPVTLEDNRTAEQVEALLQVCRHHQEMDFIFSQANADSDGRIINQLLEQYVKDQEHAVLFASLAPVLYLSAMKYSAMVLGNSSSGLVEAPSFGIPSINIGDRQKGRLQADSVINCAPVAAAIEQALSLAWSVEFRDKASKTVNPYGDGQTSGKIVAQLKAFLLADKINLQKQFYDIRG